MTRAAILLLALAGCAAPPHEVTLDLRNPVVRECLLDLAARTNDKALAVRVAEFAREEP